MNKIKIIVSGEALKRMLNTIDERIEQDADGYCTVIVNNRQLTIQGAARSVGCEYAAFTSNFHNPIHVSKLVRLRKILGHVDDQQITLQMDEDKIAILFVEI
jgi:hypothetical protein